MNVPDIEFSNYLLGFIEPTYQNFFIECGANTGYEGSISFLFEDKLKWTGLNIEPNPFCFKELAKRRPDCINENLALSNKAETVTFYMPTDGPRQLFAGQSSMIDYTNTKWKGRKTISYQVRCDTYKNVLEKHNIKEVSLFILDVEGCELKVLEGMEGSVYPKILCIENDKIDTSILTDYIKKFRYTAVGQYKNNTVYKLKK